MLIEATRKTLLDEKLVVVMRGVPDTQLKDTLHALYNGGVRIAEIAFDPCDKASWNQTAQNIAMLREESDGKMIIGAGTCVTEEILELAVKGGAQIIVSPDTNESIIAKTKENGLLSLPGAFTPSEATAAWRYGADAVKLFPYTAEDIRILKNIATPLNYIPFFCFGGVNENTISLFLKNGASGIGTGISIIKKELLENSDFGAIEKLAKLHTDAIRKATAG